VGCNYRGFSDSRSSKGKGGRLNFRVNGTRVDHGGKRPIRAVGEKGNPLKKRTRRGVRGGETNLTKKEKVTTDKTKTRSEERKNMRSAEELKP